MRNLESGDIVFTAESSHCFIGADGWPIAVKKRFPDFDEALRKEVNKEL